MNVFYLPPEEAQKLLEDEGDLLRRTLKPAADAMDARLIAGESFETAVKDYRAVARPAVARYMKNALGFDDDFPEKPADHEQREQGHGNLLTRIVARWRR